MGFGLPGVYVPKNEPWQWLYLGILLFDLLLMLAPVLGITFTDKGLRKFWLISVPSSAVFVFAWSCFPTCFVLLSAAHLFIANFSFGAAVVAGILTAFAYLSFPLLTIFPILSASHR